MCIFNKFKAKKRFTSFSGSKLFTATSYTTKLVKKTIELQRKALFQHSNRAYLISASIRFVINYNNECNNIIVVIVSNSSSISIIHSDYKSPGFIFGWLASFAAGKTSVCFQLYCGLFHQTKRHFQNLTSCFFVPKLIAFPCSCPL